MAEPAHRTRVFLTHAAPEDNEFALWLASKLALAGYRVWIDRRRLRGGDDFWDEIDRVLRSETIKQIVVFSRNITKRGVKKEMAIGEVMKSKLDDPHFMIGVRNDEVAFTDAPPELLRENILDAYPNWHDCLADLFQTLADAKVPKAPTPNSETLQRIIEAREDGRRFVETTPETFLTNWFKLELPQFIRYFRLEGLQQQNIQWLSDCRIPHVQMGLLTGTFVDLPTFAASSSFELKTEVGYEIPLDEYISGKDLGPYLDQPSASRDVINLLRQHFNAWAAKRGLKPVVFANKQTGWYFPDKLLPDNKISFETHDGRRIRRAMSGKFKTLRWHTCLLVHPKIWPTPYMRVHINVVLSEDGSTALDGDKTHKRRKRLTRSWWNAVWRDRLLASIHHITNGQPLARLSENVDELRLSAWPLTVDAPVSFTAEDEIPLSEEADDGEITPVSTLDDQVDELDEATDHLLEDAEGEEATP